MMSTIAPDPVLPIYPFSAVDQAALVKGEILLQTRSHTLIGAGVTAQMFLPVVRSQVWQQLTTYPNWTQFFPDITRSEILQTVNHPSNREHRLYQAARKDFFLLAVQVEIYLKVTETHQQRLQFKLERGSFSDFAADLTLQDYSSGTILTYSVEATPLIPVPSLFIQEAIRQDLPGNMRQMRQVICEQAACGL
ncbi:MAG: SRPBCC family protein [Thermosynechococcaceae cyanobacterium]